MALATTCPQCKTSFKVIPDQLKLRRGLVRCGVCQHVFSGIDYLRYVDESGKARPASGSAAAARPAADPRDPGSRPRPAGEPGSTRIAPPPAPGNAPQTVIGGDDELKTAFFLSDSTFGPFTEARPGGGTTAPQPVPNEVLPPAPGHDFARDFANEGTTRIGPPGADGRREPRDSGSPARSSRTTPSPTRPAMPATRPAPSAARPAPPPADSEGPSTRTRSGTGRSASTPLPAAGPSTGGRGSRRTPDPLEADEASGRPRRARQRSLLIDDDDDADVAAANALARQAREAFRSRDGDARGSRPGSQRSAARHRDIPEHFRSLADYFSDSRRTGIVIALAALLLFQLMLAFRSEIVSRMPSTRPLLEVAAGIFGMNIDTVRSLSSLTIESFELQSTERSDQIALNAVLRNRDGHVVRWPAMELTLTDQTRAVVVRKVILPTDYLNRSAPRDGLGGRSEWPVRLMLETGSMQLAGYSVALFYP